MHLFIGPSNLHINYIQNHFNGHNSIRENDHEMLIAKHQFRNHNHWLSPCAERNLYNRHIKCNIVETYACTTIPNKAYNYCIIFIIDSWSECNAAQVYTRLTQLSMYAIHQPLPYGSSLENAKPQLMQITINPFSAHDWYILHIAIVRKAFEGVYQKEWAGNMFVHLIVSWPLI